MPGYFFSTLGCQMNKSDSEVYAHVLDQAGYYPTTEDDADVVLLNTCAVREASVHKMESKIGQWVANRKKTGKPEKIGVIGCVPAIGIKEFKKKHRGVDFVLGTYSNRDEMIAAITSALELHVQGTVALSTSAVSAFVPITFGCNCFCTYCIVPYARGRLVSRPESEIIAETKQKIEAGAKEIILLGQNVNEYGLDKGEKDGFASLLEKVDELEGLKRLKFITSHPKDMDRATLERLSKLKHLAPYFHLPIQAGSDEVLRRMARGYTKAKYLELVANIRGLFDNPAITTDIIVGFPGETREQYDETLALLDKVRFDQVFVAMYSPRPGTPAAKMDGVCSHEELHYRINTLLDKQREISKKLSEESVDLTFDVLVESCDDGVSRGNSGQGRLVEIDEILPVGEIVRVKIVSASGRLKGVLV